jgi:hypothetical protein
MKATISKPLNQTQEVLHFLINRISINRRMMMLECDVFNLPDQIHKLKRKGLTIKRKQVESENKFNRIIKTTEYSIKKSEGIKLYKQLQKDSP